MESHRGISLFLPRRLKLVYEPAQSDQSLCYPQRASILIKWLSMEQILVIQDEHFFIIIIIYRAKGKTFHKGKNLHPYWSSPYAMGVKLFGKA